jgi:hypothetical protein
LIDPLSTIRTHLLAQTALTALVVDRIYAGVVYPPAEYVAGDYAITLNSRGGQVGYDRLLLSESYTFKCYGATELAAMTLYRTLVDVLDDSSAGAIRYASLEISGYPLREPEPVNWPFVLCYFRVTLNTQLGV